MQNLSYLVVHNFFGEHKRVQFHSPSRFFELVVAMVLARVLAQVWVPVRAPVSFPVQEVEVEEQATVLELVMEQQQLALAQA
jgi:hypothetical protein